MDFNQIYRAPSVPKISRSSVSSSSIRGGAAKPKINKSTFNFVKPATPQKAKVEALKQSGSVDGTLQETNQILVEIQKQLSLDFAMRIAEEKETIKKIREQRSKLKAAEKESSIEAGKKIGSPIGKVFSSVTSKAKGIFARIADFFKLLLGGIVLNAAFSWLRKPGNKEKLFGVIDFVGKYWKELLGVFIGVKVFGFLYKLLRLGRFLSRLFGFGRGRGPGPGGPGPGGRGPGGRGPIGGCGPTLKCLDKAKAYQLENFANELAKTKKFSPLFASTPTTKQPTGGGQVPWWNTALTVLGTVIDVASLIALFVPIPGGRPASLLLRGLKALPLFRGIGKASQATKVVRVATTRPATRAAGRVTKSGGNVKLTQERIAEGLKVRSKKQSREIPFDDKVQSDPRLINLANRRNEALKAGDVEAYKKALIEESQLRALSGTGSKKGGPIFGGTSSSVDNIPIMAAKGEYMISNMKNQATTFRPILDDINYNAGKMWEMFTKAVGRLSLVIQKQKNNAEKFGKNIEEHLKHVKADKINRGRSEGGGVRPIKPKKATFVGGGSRSVNVGQLVQSNEGSPIMIPMDLPTITSNPPEVPSLETKATDVPIISSTNGLNRYMDLVPEILGIVL